MQRLNPRTAVFVLTALMVSCLVVGLSSLSPQAQATATPIVTRELDSQTTTPTPTAETIVLDDWLKRFLWDPEVFAAPYPTFKVNGDLHGPPYLDHMAIDLAAGRGTTIQSPINGIVTALYHDQWGNPTIVIENSIWQVTLLHGKYYHGVGTREIHEGDVVTIGQPIGEESNFGYTTNMAGTRCQDESCGNHTHINIFDKRKGENVDPRPLLASLPPDYRQLVGWKWQLIKDYFPNEIDYWLPDIFRWSDEYHIDPLVIASIMMPESCGYPEAESSAQAMGLFQVMPPHFFPELGWNSSTWNITTEQVAVMLEPNNNAGQGVNVWKRANLTTQGDLGRAYGAYNGGNRPLRDDFINWPDETKRYHRWTTGMYTDVVNMAAGRPAPETTVLEEWLRASGGGLCSQAFAWQASHPRDQVTKAD